MIHFEFPGRPGPANEERREAILQAFSVLCVYATVMRDEGNIHRARIMATRCRLLVAAFGSRKPFAKAG